MVPVNPPLPIAFPEEQGSRGLTSATPFVAFCVSLAFLVIEPLICRRDAGTTVLQGRLTRECLCDCTLTSMLAAFF